MSSESQWTYERRRPEESVLYNVVQGHLETVLADARERSDSGQGYPAFVENALRAYLRCGILAHGFCRCVCKECGFERAVPFSCKSSVCPSCHARRMSEVAAKLCDERLPEIPYRQWVMSFPRWVRIQLLRKKRLFAQATGDFIRRVFAWQRRQARALGIREPLCGAIAIPQLFGGRLNANPHVHAVFCDGVFTRFTRGRMADDGELRFRRLFPPTREELWDIAVQVGRRVLARLENARESELAWDDDHTILATERAAATDFPKRSLSAAPSEPPRGLSAFVEGFSLHAGVVIEADDRAALERLLRYAARFPFADRRLSRTADGRVVVKLKRPWPTTGETELIFEPAEFLRKLIALMPPPRTHRVRYFGVFSSHAKVHHEVRNLVLRPQPDALCGHDPDTGTDTGTDTDTDPGTGTDTGTGTGTDPEEAEPKSSPEAKPLPRSTRIAWAKLLARVFQIDVETCPRCGGRMKIVAAVTDPSQVCRYLTHAGLPTGAPEPAPARAPPQTEWTFHGH